MFFSFQTSKNRRNPREFEYFHRNVEIENSLRGISEEFEFAGGHCNRKENNEL